MTPLRILVVDDDVDSARMLQVLLELLGHEAHVAHGAEKALELAKSVKPELALLDVTLPDADGFELARRLQSTPGLERVALVAITGWSDAETAARARRQGFRHLLVKPIDDAALDAALEEAQAIRGA